MVHGCVGVDSDLVVAFRVVFVIVLVVGWWCWLVLGSCGCLLGLVLFSGFLYDFIAREVWGRRFVVCLLD